MAAVKFLLLLFCCLYVVRRVTTTERTLFVTPDKDDLRTNTVTFTGAEKDVGEFMGLHQRIRRAAADAAATTATGNSGAGSTTSTSTTTKAPPLDEDKDEKKIIPKVSRWRKH